MRLFLALAAFLMAVNSQAAFQVPALTGPVVDQGGMLTAHDERLLSDLIRRFEQTGKAQLQVLTVQNLGGLPIEQASIEVVEKWKLGGAKTDNGLLFIVAVDDRKIRIEVGQGLEGVIPDAIAKRIIEDVMIPLFRQGSASQGVVMGVYQAMKKIDQEFQADHQLERATSSRRSSSTWEGIVIFMAILIIILFGSRGGRGRRRGIMGGVGGFSTGWGGGFGGGGGGGWSGGGGGFSGGGASGSW